MSTLQEERLGKLCQDLGLSTINEVYAHLAEEASKENWTYLDFLEKLLDEEVSEKFRRRIKVKMQMAGFPYLKTLAQFDFSFQPSVDKRKIKELSALKFIEEKENVIFFRTTRGRQNPSCYLSWCSGYRGRIKRVFY